MLRRNKILLFSLFAFFSFSNVFAREMTIDELGSRATDLKHDHVNYIYIIGEYAFTDKYQLKTEDIMYASRSIHLDVEYDGTNVTEVLSKMNIQQVGAKIENWELKGWEVRENIVGKEKLNPSQKMNIKYIDYVLQPEKTSAMLNADLSNGNFSTYVQVLEKYLGFKLDESYENGKLTVENGKAKGLLLKNSHITLNKEDQIKYKDAEYYFAYVLEIPNATKDTKVTVSGLNRENEGILDWKDFDVTPEKGNGTTPGIVVLVPLKKEDIQKDPILTVQVDLDGNKKD